MQALLRFLHSVRMRLPLLAAFVALGVVVGVTYYATAKRKYQSRAVLLVQKVGANTKESDGVESHKSTSDEMPTFEKMFVEDAVLQSALLRLPPEHLGDLLETPKERWLTSFRSRF